MLPEGWKRTTLGQIAHIKSGSTPSRLQQTLYFSDGRWPWVKTMDLTNGEITSTDECITDAALENTSCTLFPEGTVLVAMYGGFKQIGRTGLLMERSAINQAISAIQLVREVANPNYVLHWLNANVDEWKGFAASSRKDPNITREDVCNFPIALPPLSEQVCIAGILETWDAAIISTEKLLTNSREQKQVLVQQLLTGKRRLKQFVCRKERHTTRFGSIPTDWQHVPIEQVAEEFSAKNAANRQLPVLSCTKYAGLVNSLSYFNKQIFSQDISTYKIVERGCFAYATNHIDEGSIGYQNLYDEALISPMYTVFKPSSDIDHGFLFKLLKTEHYRQIFAANTNASVDRRGSLRWSDFKKIEIPLPHMAEQIAISSVIDGAQSEIESIERQLDKLKEEKRALMQQLLTGKRRVRLPDQQTAEA